MEREIPAEISENLYPGENVAFCIKKKLTLEAKPKFLAVTDRRVIYLDQKLLGRYELADIPYEKLEFVHFRHGKLGAEFILKSEEGKTLKLSWMDKKEAQDAIVAIRDALNTIAVEPVSIQKKKKLIGEEWKLTKPREFITRSLPMTRVVEVSKREVPKEDPIEKLKKLKELYEIGAITREEFEEKKKKLLEQI
jgi:hypothetical protein